MRLSNLVYILASLFFFVSTFLVAPAARAAAPYYAALPATTCRYEGMYDPDRQVWLSGEYKPLAPASAPAGAATVGGDGASMTARLKFLSDQNREFSRQMGIANQANDGPTYRRLLASRSANDRECAGLKRAINQYRASYGMAPTYGIEYGGKHPYLDNLDTCL